MCACCVLCCVLCVVCVVSKRELTVRYSGGAAAEQPKPAEPTPAEPTPAPGEGILFALFFFSFFGFLAHRINHPRTTSSGGSRTGTFSALDFAFALLRSLSLSCGLHARSGKDKT